MLSIFGGNGFCLWQALLIFYYVLLELLTYFSFHVSPSSLFRKELSFSFSTT